MDAGRVEDFHAFLGTALQNLGSELWREYLRASAGQAAERRRLAEEVERLQAQLRTFGGCAADEPQHGLALVQPPPSARVALLQTEDTRRAEVVPLTIAPALLHCSDAFAVAYADSKNLSQISTEDLPSAETALGEAENPPLLHPFNKRALPRLVFRQEPVSPLPSASATDSMPKGPEGLGPSPVEVTARSSSAIEVTARSSRTSSDSGQRPMATLISRADLQNEWLKRRLLTRLAPLRSKGLVRGRDLHQTMCTLGLHRYSAQEMDRLIMHVSMAIGLQFRERGGPSPRRMQSAVSNRSGMSEMEARAEWLWPEYEGTASVRAVSTAKERAISVLSHSSGSASSLDSDKSVDKVMVIPFKALIELFSKDEWYLEKCLGQQLTDQVYAMREVLLTGEANRIISEMTFVTIDDLATNRRRRDPTRVVDTLVASVILINGIAVGMQTDPRFRDYAFWNWIEASFAVFFAVEVLVRIRLIGCRAYFSGPDRWWHIFDSALVAFGALDCATDFANASELPSPGAFRFIRFARLFRLVRVFRFKFMLELRLMVKAVLSGMRTLFWAFVLLAFVLYTLGVASAIVFGDAPDPAVQGLFANVPTAMFTTFRCVSGDCFTASGASLTATLFAQYGMLFALVFVATYMVITLGLFNVILAIYVDVTMVAVKQTDDANKGKHEQESIRVAQLTKRLLKMFCAAHRAYGKLPLTERHSSALHNIMKAADTTDVEIDDDIVISREMYMLITQDSEVRKIMDELDIPPDRAALFDCFDADGSGGLQATELVRGFLKVRGEVKKADHVACILALRSIQTMVKHVEDTIQEHGRLLDLIKEGQDAHVLDKVDDGQP